MNSKIFRSSLKRNMCIYWCLALVACISVSVQLCLFYSVYYRSKGPGRKDYVKAAKFIPPAPFSAHSYPIFPRPKPFLNFSIASNDTSQQKIILLWTAFYLQREWGLPAFGSELFKRLRCPVSNCFVTRDRNLLPRAEVVVLNFRIEDFRYKDVPKNNTRKPNQRWTFLLWESPDYTYSASWITNKEIHHALKDFSNFFNWTMTYRLDSDVRFHFGRHVPLAKPDFRRVGYDRLKDKTRSVVWMNSHCRTVSHREAFVNELEKYIDVDSIGKCGSNVPPLIKKKCVMVTYFTATADECGQYLSQNYKFYLAFENSLCRDYVSEKFYRPAGMELIPVVFNGANMSLFAPPHSYIDAQDFSSPESLAQFLKMVGSDKELYNSYFWWKPYYDVEQVMDKRAYRKHFCGLCEQAHLSPSMPRSSYSDIDKWWSGDGHCYDGEESWPAS